MRIETQRLLIREVRTEDGMPFARMAADGSLEDCGFDRGCGSWMAEWIVQAQDFVRRNHPDRDYLAYTITLKEEAVVIGSVGCSYYEDFLKTGITYFIGAQYRNNDYGTEAVKAYAAYFLKNYDVKGLIVTVRNENVPSWNVVEKAGFVLSEKRMYKDLNDEEEKLYRFYEIRK